MKIGAHISISDGLQSSVAGALSIEANCLQIFSSPPVQWAVSSFSAEEIAEFNKLVDKKGLRPVFIHAPYLVNLASNNPQTRKLSVNAVKLDLDFADRINAVGVIFHIGSHKGQGKEYGFRQLLGSVENILARNNTASLIFENGAGEKNKIGSTFEDIAYILKKIDHKRLVYCLDSAHLYSAGYPLSSDSDVEPPGFTAGAPFRAGSAGWRNPVPYAHSSPPLQAGRSGTRVNRTIKMAENVIGLEKLVVLHINDTMTKLGGGRDKHENIGEGNIGTSGFKALINHPLLRDLPFIIETPGFDRQRPDRKNIRILKSLAT